MVERVFLGWDEPFINRAVAWLSEQRDDLATMIVVVPTAQSGRRLRETLAEKSGALLSPKVVTSGSFLKSRDDESAADWIERLAWLDVLEHIVDWSAYSALFPQSPGDGSSWAAGLALEMVQLRHSLQENGLLLATAARKLHDTIEAERWESLARLENLVEQKLQNWGLKSRSIILADGLLLSDKAAKIVLAGVVEMPPLVEWTMLTTANPVVVLIGAPAHEAEGFSVIGRPLPSWTKRSLSQPNGSTQVVADPRQQAMEALRLVSEKKSSSVEVALGSADGDVGDELAQTFSQADWPTFHPATIKSAGGLTHWFKIWSAWLADPKIATLADLLTLPETGTLVANQLAQKAKRLAELRDRWMIAQVEDLQRKIAAEHFRKSRDKESAEDILRAAEALLGWRNNLLNDDFLSVMQRLLATLGGNGPKTEEESNNMATWLNGAAGMMSRVERGPKFWIELMLSELPSPAPLPPEGRVLDVQGWLELFYEPGQHLVLCGMNDGKVPARSGGEPWLSEASRDRLGLIKDADRAARDAFLYHSMLEARRSHGRVDVICGKSGAGGESLLPSRLLLAVDSNGLPERVKTLFREIEPPDAGISWQKDFSWTPRVMEPRQRFSVTSLKDYLACPFRYYLKHVLKMKAPAVGRAEWDACDFGSVAHQVLERWGRDTEARNTGELESIHSWLCAELDRVVAEWFGQKAPLAIRIQTESLRQRFLWFARVQSENWSDGWRIVDVERKIELPVSSGHIVAKIDRIDRHEQNGELRVIDYKTGKVKKVDGEHRKQIKETSALPLHIHRESPAIYAIENQKYLWKNLQLPLYAAALVEGGEPMPVPCYFTLPSTEAKVALHEWSDFEMCDFDAAQACAEWITGQIASKNFWPPAEKVYFDDYKILAAGKSFEEMFVPSHC